ncbi:MAG: PAS domain S-box protein [Methylotenera sp.]|nr:PAS domain S-box protein [Methylotenera sp.]MDP1959191.1 PAS domain S-box protein [Methylotenera sp.]MDP3303328.1 PAS domain S-box protein [Methylotenera sp.]MDP3943017.1 PAS domain S-box protein [Methylotenera sp.]
MTDPLKDLSFKTLFEAVADAMLLVNDKGHIIRANAVALDLLGYAEKEICGLEVEALMPEKYRAQHHHHRSAFYRKPEKRAMGSGKALSILRHNGEVLTVDISLSPMQSKRQFYVLVTLHVADRRNQAEEALRISEERLMLAKQAAGLGVFDFDSNHNIWYWDERMRELWGAESNEAIATKQFLTAIHPEDRAAREAALDRSIDPAGNGEYSAEYRVTNPANGVEQWISAIGRMHFEDGVAIRLVGVARDITEQKILEKNWQTHRSETEALFAQQVASQTVSAIAHELNQPLAAISAYSEVALHALQNDHFDQKNLKQALDGCVKQSQRAGRSLHELLAFLQKGELITEKLNLNNIVLESLNLAKSYGYGEFQLELQLEPDLPTILGHRVQIQKILVNLLTNAVEAMRGAGVPTAAITIKVSTNAELNMAHVIVQDSGPGLDAITANRIFEPFFTTKHNGIGMGLAISRALTEANGGRLWLEPNVKAGAIFHLTLPFAP